MPNGNEQPPNTSDTFTSATAATFSADQELRLEEISDRMLNGKITKALNKVLGYIITAVIATAVGAMFAIAWNLNGMIYEAVGKQSVAKEISDFKLEEFKQKNQELEKKVRYYECMDDERITNKSGCRQ